MPLTKDGDYFLAKMKGHYFLIDILLIELEYLQRDRYMVLGIMEYNNCWN